MGRMQVVLRGHTRDMQGKAQEGRVGKGCDLESVMNDNTLTLEGQNSVLKHYTLLVA